MVTFKILNNSLSSLKFTLYNFNFISFGQIGTSIRFEESSSFFGILLTRIIFNVTLSLVLIFPIKDILIKYFQELTSFIKSWLNIRATINLFDRKIFVKETFSVEAAFPLIEVLCASLRFDFESMIFICCRIERSLRSSTNEASFEKTISGRETLLCLIWINSRYQFDTYLIITYNFLNDPNIFVIKALLDSYPTTRIRNLF